MDRLPERKRSTTSLPRRMSADGLQACLDKMRREGLADAAVETFAHYYEQLEAGESGLMPEATIEPVDVAAGRRRAADVDADRRSSTAPW